MSLFHQNDGDDKEYGDERRQQQKRYSKAKKGNFNFMSNTHVGQKIVFLGKQLFGFFFAFCSGCWQHESLFFCRIFFNWI